MKDNPVAVVGIGRTAYSRDSGRTTGALAAQACREALADAGLTRDQYATSLAALATETRALADRVRAPGLEVDVDIPEHVSAAPAVEVALHRIAAEALANAVRHSRARRVSLRVRDGRHVEPRQERPRPAPAAVRPARCRREGTPLQRRRRRDQRPIGHASRAPARGPSAGSRARL